MVGEVVRGKKIADEGVRGKRNVTLMATYPAPGCLIKLSKEVVIAIGGRFGVVKERNTIVGGLCSNELVNSNRQKYPLGNFFF